ncbi:DUF928 domain-containing protein [Scytonema sp. PRP1]|uniref:DUF928 domain-containing protein n=1 Tax=Scytonema sp. PRP1 TaxID=3120513 RepID=UPI002FD6E33C
MFQIRSCITHWLRAILSLILVVVLVLNDPSQALANPFENIIQRVQSIFAPPKTKAKQTAIAGRGVAGAGRGRCPALVALGKDEIPLTAFVPVIQEEQSSSSNSDDISLSKLNYVWGKTTEAYPTFLFYIPYVYKKSEVEYGKFVLLDKDKHRVTGPIFVKIPVDKPSIAKFTLPESAKPLEINQEYTWYFSIICNPLKPSRNPGVTGWIERVQLPILPPQNYLYYAQQGIWYDTVTHLVENANIQTQSAQKDWILLVNYIFPNVKDKDTLQQISSVQDIQELIPEPNPPTL